MAEIPAPIKRLLGLAYAYREMWNTRSGKRVLEDILKECGVPDSDPHVPGDPFSTHVNVGKQWVGRGILRKLKLDDDQILAMGKESYDDG